MKQNGTHQIGLRRGQAGFTLVEILIVVVILGILAAIVVPNMSSATDQASVSSLQMSVRRIRNQIEFYRAKHNNLPPTLVKFEDQMTMSSKSDGSTAAPGTAGYPWGPYLDKVPVNPFTGTNTVGAGAVGDSAWYYDETTGAFHANDSAENRAF